MGLERSLRPWQWLSPSFWPGAPDSYCCQLQTHCSSDGRVPDVGHKTKSPGRVSLEAEDWCSISATCVDTCKGLCGPEHLEEYSREIPS